MTQSVAGSRSVIAHWLPPYPTVVLRGPEEYRDALLGDQGALVLHFAHPSMERDRYVPEWLSFETTVDDPACPPRRLPEPTVSARASPPWPTVVAILRARAEREAEERTHVVRGIASRVTSTDERDPRRALVTVETRLPGDGTWRATYAVDQMAPAILDARYERTSASP